MTEMQKREWKEKRDRIREERKQNFIRRDEFHKQLREKTLKTFEDKPDAVKSLRCTHVEGHMFIVEWDAPQDNNSPITRYNVYLSNKKVKINQTQLDIGASIASGTYIKHELVKIGGIEDPSVRSFKVEGLELGTRYYLVITAENMYGEGYKAPPALFMTLSQDVEKDALTLYVWGSNNN
jgi:hypothetical protein